MQELLTLPEHLSAPPVLSAVRVTRSLVLYICFVDRPLYFFFWPLCCLFFFDIRILITPLVYSNSFGFQLFSLGEYLINVIPEMHRARSIRYLCIYYCLY